MPVNRNALIRYTTIDKCLRNRYRRWTLEDLIDACSDALYEFEGIKKGISQRTIQLDIQVMRSEKLGYNAPITVVDKKYFTYEDPEYSITQLPLSDNDLNKLNDAVEILKQFQDFSHFKEMNGLIQKLENKVYTEMTQARPIIHLDKNEDLKGLKHLNGLYQAILKKQTLKIEYQSFRAKNSQRIYFFPYLLKEFNNRWFLVGKRTKGDVIFNLALDRIQEFNIYDEIHYVDDESFNPNEFYKDTVGVTINKGLMPRKVILKIDKENAPYVLTKPIHSSQELIEETNDGVVIAIKVVPNFELERVILGYGESIEVLSPPSLRKRIGENVKRTSKQYQDIV